MPRKTKTPKQQRAGFAQRLALVRRYVGYDTMAGFARAIGVEEETYRRWERAETEPPLHILERIHKVANVSLDFLVAGDIPPPQTSDTPPVTTRKAGG